MSTFDHVPLASRRAQLGMLLVFAIACAAAPTARAYESIRRDSPEGRSLSEIARRLDVPVEVMLGPHAWHPQRATRDTTGRAARRAAAGVALRTRMDAGTDATLPIVFAAPPIPSSLPPGPPTPVVADSLKAHWLGYAVGDLDGDGLADLVGVESADSVLDVRRGLGGGSYAPAVHYRLASNALKPALGDFNGDGYLDVEVVNWPDWTSHESSTVARAFSVLLNEGDGALGARIDGDLPRQPSDIVVADLDRDGRSDLVFPLAGCGVVELATVRSHADGSFGPAELLVPEADAAGCDMPAAAVGDIDGDGNPDILVDYERSDCYAHGCVGLAVFYGHGDGTFEDAVLYGASPLGADADVAGVSLQDVDGDHRADVIVSLESGYNPRTQSRALIRNDGARRLEAPAIRPIGRTPYVLAAGRFRAGALPDLVVSDANSAALLRSRGDGTLAAEVLAGTGELVGVVDLNGDGLSDVLTAHGDSIEVRLADGTGGLGAATLLTGARFLAVADFTGEGFPDLAVLLPGGDLALVAGDGAGGFGAPLDVGPASGIRFPLQAADLDGDGIADLAWAATGMRPNPPSYSYEDSLFVRWGTGGGFTPASAFDLGSAIRSDAGNSTFPMDLELGDFNGDGLSDLVLVNGDGEFGEGGYLRVVLGLDHRTFGSPGPELNAGEDPYEAVVADFDGDGRSDIAVSATTTDDTGELLVYRGSADGSLTEVPGPYRYEGCYALEHYAFGIATGDFNGDGRTDVAVGCGAMNYKGADVLVLPNTSTIDLPTLTIAALVSAEVRDGAIELVWDMGGARAGAVSIERQAPHDGWAALATALPDGEGRVAYADHHVSAGARYGYRLRLPGAAGALATTEAWVDVPGAPRFAVRPNPARGSVEFTLPAPSTTGRLELVDLQGRVRWRRDVAAGETAIGWDGATRDGVLAPGLYWARLVTPAGEQRRRVVWLR